MPKIVILSIKRSSPDRVVISYSGDRKHTKIVDDGVNYDNLLLECTEAKIVFIEPTVKIEDYKLDVKNLLRFKSVTIKNSVLSAKDLQILIDNCKNLEITCDEKVQGVDYKDVSCTMRYNPLDCPGSVFRNVIIDNNQIIYEFLSSLRDKQTDIEKLTLCPTFSDNIHVGLFLDLMQNVNIPDVTLNANVYCRVFNLSAFVGLNKFTSINIFEFTKVTYLESDEIMQDNVLRSFNWNAYVPKYIKTILENNK